MMRTRLLLFFCFLCLTLGCENNAQRKTDNDLEQSITLITLGIADSVTSGNQLHGGIANFFFVDLANDSFILYEKAFHLDSTAYFTKGQVSGKIKDLSRNEKIVRFVRETLTRKSNNSIPTLYEGGLYCGKDYIGVIKSDTITKDFAFRYDFGFADIKGEVMALLANGKNIQSLDTTVNLNEDSVLRPVLSRPIFSAMRPLPPPDLPPPPPPIRN
ncbi:hypothetical protein [Rufibacter soli]